MTTKRKYSKCVWCGKTIDVTKDDTIELCNDCAEYPSQMVMEKAKAKGR